MVLFVSSIIFFFFFLVKMYVQRGGIICSVLKLLFRGSFTVKKSYSLKLFINSLNDFPQVFFFVLGSILGYLQFRVFVMT